MEYFSVLVTSQTFHFPGARYFLWCELGVLYLKLIMGDMPSTLSLTCRKWEGSSTGGDMKVPTIVRSYYWNPPLGTTRRVLPHQSWITSRPEAITPGPGIGRRWGTECGGRWTSYGTGLRPPYSTGWPATCSMNVDTQAFAGHLGEVELTAISTSVTVIVGFNFGLLVVPLATVLASLSLVIDQDHDLKNDMWMRIQRVSG